MTTKEVNYKGKRPINTRLKEELKPKENTEFLKGLICL